MTTTMTTLPSFNTLFSNSTPTSPPSRYTTTPQTKKARYLEARSKKTPRADRKEPTKQPQTTSASRSVGSGRQQPRTPPSKSAPTTPERWANGLVSPPPSALPMPCFDDDDDVVIPASRPISSAQRQLVFA